MGERARLALGKLELLVLREPLERECQHLAIAAKRLGLELRLELVVALEQPGCLLDPEDALELRADARGSSRSGSRSSRRSPEAALVGP